MFDNITQMGAICDTGVVVYCLGYVIHFYSLDCWSGAHYQVLDCDLDVLYDSGK